MITKKTVLVLGAGASAHLGYPLGSELVSQICTIAEDQSYDEEIEEFAGARQIGEFGRRLRLSGCDSIDGFLEYNEDCIKLGCMLIAECLKRYEIGERLHPERAGWYRYFFNAIAGKAPEDVESAPITVVTFNYDRSLEAYIHQCIANRYNMHGADAAEVLHAMRIIHLHGILGEYPGVPYEQERDILPLERISEKIRIIHQIEDKPDGFCTLQFEEANKALQEAERVFFLGFGFNEDNIRRLRYFTPESMAGRQVKSTSYGLYPAMKEALLSRLDCYGFQAHHFSIQTNNTCEEFWQWDAALE